MNTKTPSSSPHNARLPFPLFTLILVLLLAPFMLFILQIKCFINLNVNEYKIAENKNRMRNVKTRNPHVAFLLVNTQLLGIQVYHRLLAARYGWLCSVHAIFFSQ